MLVTIFISYTSRHIHNLYTHKVWRKLKDTFDYPVRNAVPWIHANKRGRAPRFYENFLCCTRSDVPAHAPTLLHTLRHCCTRSDVAAHAPTWLHTLLWGCCTRSGAAAHAPPLLHTLRGCCTRSGDAAHAPFSEKFIKARGSLLIRVDSW